MTTSIAPTRARRVRGGNPTTGLVIGLFDRQPVRVTASEPTVIPTPAWWTCPAWCSGGDNCFGGETLDLGNGTVTTSRMHHAVVLAETVPDADGGTIDVRVEVTAVEDPDEGFVEAPAVMVNVDGLTTDPDTAERIAAAILAAVAAARQPLSVTARTEVAA